MGGHPSDIDKYAEYVQDMLDVRLEGQENSSARIWGRRANELAEKLGLPCPYDRAEWSPIWMMSRAFGTDSKVEEKLRGCIDAATELKKQRRSKIASASKARKLHRDAEIAAILGKTPDIKLAQLAKELNVSEATVSRSAVWRQHRKRPPRDMFTTHTDSMHS